VLSGFMGKGYMMSGQPSHHGSHWEPLNEGRRHAIVGLVWLAWGRWV
jgi:hypothetical protein